MIHKVLKFADDSNMVSAEVTNCDVNNIVMLTTWEKIYNSLVAGLENDLCCSILNSGTLYTLEKNNPMTEYELLGNDLSVVMEERDLGL